MSDYELKLKNHEFIGIVEDTNDPDKKQRVRIRIPYLHGTKNEIPTDALPWAHPKRSNNGFSFSIPEVNKIVMVTFPSGNAYFPVYNDAVHLNINLQKKIESYDGDDYASFMAICYNYNTQIFVDNEALNMYYKLNGVKVMNDRIILDLKDNESNILLGDENASQQAVLGTNFFKWMDELVKVLSNAYIGNSGVAVIPNPDLVRVLSNYGTQRKDFISQHVHLVENRNIQVAEADIDATIGDKYDLIAESGQLDVRESSLTTIDIQSNQRSVDFEPTPANINKGALLSAEFQPVLSGNSETGEDVYEQKEPIDITDQDKIDEINETYALQDDVKVFESSSDIYFGEGDDVLFDDSYLKQAAEANPINYGSGVNGSAPTILPDVAYDPVLPNPASGNQKKDIQKMKRYLNSKGYVYHNAPFILNIIGIRAAHKDSGNLTNRFEDYMWVFCTNDKGQEEFYKFAITTTPGCVPGTNHLPADPVAMVTYGQYPTYQIKLHNGDASHPCLGLSTNNFIRNAPNANRYYTVSEYTPSIKSGAQGFNIHNSGNYQNTDINKKVDNWSKGCQVIRNYNDWLSFMKLCYRQRDKAKHNKFTYTLIPEKEFSKFK